MHDAAKGRVAIFLGQYVGHIIICRAGMDDQGQPGPLGCLDMNFQTLLLHQRGVGGVMIIQTAFPDSNKFGMLGN